jgi:hypothetical protein
MAKICRLCFAKRDKGAEIGRCTARLHLSRRPMRRVLMHRRELSPHNGSQIIIEKVLAHTSAPIRPTISLSGPSSSRTRVPAETLQGSSVCLAAVWLCGNSCGSSRAANPTALTLGAGSCWKSQCGSEIPCFLFPAQLGLVLRFKPVHVNLHVRSVEIT